MKIAFVTDTGTGQHPDYWKEKGIYCLPLQITCDEESKDEYTEIKLEELPAPINEALKKSFPDAVLSKAYKNDTIDPDAPDIDLEEIQNNVYVGQSTI